MIPQHMADNFADAYPEELLREREAMLRSFWTGKGSRAILSVHDGSFPYRQIDDDDLIVENAARTILASALLSDAYLPWFGPDFGTISTAIYWGGEVVQPEGGNVFIKPVIHSAEQVSEHYPLAPEAGHCPRAIKLNCYII